MLFSSIVIKALLKNEFVGKQQMGHKDVNFDNRMEVSVI